MFGGGDTDLTILTPDGTNLPVVLFLPGFQLNPPDYTSTREHLASHGFYVVSAAFPGNLFNSKTHTELKEITKDILTWVEEQAAGEMAGIIDASRIASVGHSLGGKVSLLTIGPCLLLTGPRRGNILFGRFRAQTFLSMVTNHYLELNFESFAKV